MTEQEKKEPPSFSQTLWQSFVADQKDAIRFALAGAIVGAVLGSGAGIYLFELLAWIGIGVGLIAGALIGGVGLWLMYQFA